MGAGRGVTSRKDRRGEGFAAGGVGILLFSSLRGASPVFGMGVTLVAVVGGRDGMRGGGREGRREGASRSSSSVSDVESLAAWATVAVFEALALGRACSKSLVGCKGRFSGLEYPAAARVCDTTPCRPVNPVRAFFGLVVMKRCNCVPCQGSSCLSSSKSLISLSSKRPFARFGTFILSTAAFTLILLASASFLLRVSSRMLVIESTGREMIVDVFRCLAAFLRRIYSA